MKAKRIVFDAKTKEQKIEEFDFVEQPSPPPKKGVDLEKLKMVLLKKRVILKKEEIE